jgi:D-Ala-D-Ala carboxypeptidase 3 (S13) family
MERPMAISQSRDELKRSEQKCNGCNQHVAERSNRIRHYYFSYSGVNSEPDAIEQPKIGGRHLGGPVSLEKSLRIENEMLAAHGIDADIHLEEGSGISRNNRFTARGLAKILGLFAPHADLLRGHDGGLNKTGTMEGVRTLAGYANTSSHGQVRFVISLAGNDGEMRFRILRAIEAGL